jgi:hypothetical protein
VDFAIASLDSASGDLYRKVDLTAELLKARYRSVDCLASVDRSLEAASRAGFVDGSYRKLAAACAREFPGRAEHYLGLIRLGEGRALAEDEIAEIRGGNACERIAKLSRAPQTEAILERLVGLCQAMLDRLPDLRGPEIAEFAPLLARMAPGSVDLDHRAAAALAKLITPPELERLSGDAQTASALAAGIIR